MSKESRRRQRMAGQASVERAAAPDRKPEGTAGASTRSERPSTSPRGTHRAGRRERARPATPASFVQRYRRWIVAAGIVAVVAIVGAGVFSAATQPAYACSTIWQPTPSASPSAGASPQLGYVQPDMGNSHVAVGTTVKYTYCPPASGRHYNASGQGPIAARPYGPTDTVVPPGWVHNLEHGALVVLYKGGEADQTALRGLFDAMPNSPVCGFPPGGNAPSPVIARFDDMAWPYAALVWDRVLPLDTVDTAAVLDFYTRYGERDNPEKLCSPPSPSVEPSASPS
ncbi:MAG TPA: DUF3105 domain-containing protein [Candidatus Limnocylindrales bacterium]